MRLNIEKRFYRYKLEPPKILILDKNETTFYINEFIIVVFLVVNSDLKPLLQCVPPRRKGAAPALSDREVLSLIMTSFFD
ncbi:MAG: hypothetical protein AAF827_07795 [Cyanobacteria bacterium P01_D01_bin.6]